MNIIIPSETGTEFVSFINSSIYQYLQDNLDKDRLQNAQTFVDTVNMYRSIYVPKIDVYSVCLYPVLKIDTYSSYTQVSLDTNALVYGTLIKSIDIINLVNFGNIGVQPYPIFTNMFSYFNSNLLNIYDQFTFDIGGLN